MTSRREFLRLAALAGAGAALGGAACGSGNGRSEAGQKPAASPGGGERTLRIIQWTHFVPAYDHWFDNEYTRRWGEEHDVKVVVDHILAEQLPERAQAEVAAQRGHDLFFNVTAGGPALEDEVIDHREIVEEAEAKVGKMTPLVERTILNPKTGKYFGFSDLWAPGPVNYRTDLWDPKDRFLTEGRTSLVVNAISSLRAAEAQDPDLAGRIGLLPTPEGPEGRHGVHIYGTYAIFRFARHQELAKQFLVDLVADYRQAFEKSGFYNFPAFPGSVPDLVGIVAREPKYGLLADASTWSTNMGYPGHTNAAVDEVFTQFVIAEMFAMAAKGEATAEEAVAMAEARITPIFDKWRQRGKI